MDHEGYENKSTYEANYYQRAFLDYFEGAILGDFAMVREAANTIENMDIPFNGGFELWARSFEQKILDQEHDLKSIEILIGNGIRVYAYSGIPVNREIVRLVTEFFGYDEEWLRFQVFPTRTLLYVIESELDEDELFTPQDRKNYRQRGLRATEALGLPTTLSARAKKILAKKAAKLTFS